MASKLVLLFAASAAANYTTSYMLPGGFGTDRIRFLGSVVGAEGDRMTVAITPDNDPKFAGLGLGNGTSTYTLASTLFAFSSETFEIGRPVTTTQSGSARSYACDIQPTATAVACTLSVGSALALNDCRVGRSNFTRPGTTWTSLWTFSDTDTAGVATLVQSLPAFSNVPRPEWCGPPENSTEISVPTSALVRTSQIPKDLFTYYKVVITAGEDKIPSPTPSRNEPSDSDTSGSPGSAPVKTLAPALAGLGAAMAVFL